MKKFMIGIAMFAIAGAASAEMIAEWTSEADPPSDATFAATASASVVSTAGMERGNLAETNQEDANRGFKPWAVSGTEPGEGPGPRTFEEAVSMGSYLSFTVELSSGSMNVTNVYMDLKTGGNRLGLDLRSSADSYADSLFTDGGAGYEGAVDLSSNSDFENLTEIEFRVYAWGNRASQTWNAATVLRLDHQTDGIDFQVNGVVPEPATVGMLGLGALVALLVRRVRA